MLICSLWFVGTFILLFIAVELSSKYNETSASYSKSRWLGAHENESADWFSERK